MEIESRRPKGREDAISALNESIKALSFARGFSHITPARVIFDSVSDILKMIGVSFFLVLCRPTAD